jgi:hypothetical protein
VARIGLLAYLSAAEREMKRRRKNYRIAIIAMRAKLRPEIAALEKLLDRDLSLWMEAAG